MMKDEGQRVDNVDDERCEQFPRHTRALMKAVSPCLFDNELLKEELPYLRAKIEEYRKNPDLAWAFE